MIVKISDNSSYVNLFKRANDALKITEASSKINDINSYFARIVDLIKVTPYDPVLAILPVDEPMFVIDANTRKITIPSIFSNGVSVVGDEHAEILYFEIDRYFDLQDLDQTIIVIQSQLPSGKKYFSPAFNKTVNFPGKPNKLIFGWPLTQEITAEPGNVQFAIRFYNTKENLNQTQYASGDLEGKELTYSLSTLVHTIKINPSLNFTIYSEDPANQIETITKHSQILQYLKNSTNIPEPVFINPAFCRCQLENVKNEDNTFSWEPRDLGIKLLDNSDQIVGYNDNSNENEEKMILFAKASYDYKDAEYALESGGIAGPINYIWYRAPLDNPTQSSQLSDGVEMKYYLTSDTAYNKLDIYYTPNLDPEDKKENPMVVTNSSIAYNFDEEKRSGNVYEAFTKAEITQAGYYSVKAFNSDRTSDSAQGVGSSSYYVVGGPCDLAIAVQGPNNETEGTIIPKDETLQITMTPYTYTPIEGQPIYSKDNHNYNFTWYYANKEFPIEQYDEIFKSQELKESYGIREAGQKGAINNKNIHDKNGILIDTESGNTLDEIPSTDFIIDTKEKEGYYFISGKNRLFGEDRYSTSKLFHLTRPAAPVTSDNFTINYTDVNDNLLALGNQGAYSVQITETGNENEIIVKEKVEIKNNDRVDELTYQWWYKLSGSAFNQIPGATENVLRRKNLNNNPTTLYKCQVISNYNGNSKEQLLSENDSAISISRIIN